MLHGLDDDPKEFRQIEGEGCAIAIASSFAEVIGAGIGIILFLASPDLAGKATGAMIGLGTTGAVIYVNAVMLEKVGNALRQNWLNSQNNSDPHR